jgi:hypothetical protein
MFLITNNDLGRDLHLEDFRRLRKKAEIYFGKGTGELTVMLFARNTVEVTR